MKATRLSIIRRSLSFHWRVSLHCRHSVQQAAAFWGCRVQRDTLFSSVIAEWCAHNHRAILLTAYYKVENKRLGV